MGEGGGREGKKGGNIWVGNFFGVGLVSWDYSWNLYF